MEKKPSHHFAYDYMAHLKRTRPLTNSRRSAEDGSLVTSLRVCQAGRSAEGDGNGDSKTMGFQGMNSCDFVREQQEVGTPCEN